MDWEEKPVRPKAQCLGEDLKTLSVGELEAWIVALKAEIQRVEAEIAAKKAHERAASALFKTT
jgi:uncharacterized small protein (DUF1192 family)